MLSSLFSISYFYIFLSFLGLCFSCLSVWFSCSCRVFVVSFPSFFVRIGVFRLPFYWFVVSSSGTGVFDLFVVFAGVFLIGL